LIVSQFHGVLYVFGIILIYTGVKLFGEKKEEHIDFSKNRVIRGVKRWLPFTANHHSGHFFVKEGENFLFTSLFLIVVLIESTDIIFAVDSIPAAFAISEQPFIIFTSNIFAILGMRSLFFVIEGVMHKFHHLQKGLSFVLVFIGGKMLSGLANWHISSLVSFSVIMSVLCLSVLASLYWPKRF